jgi:hypothetical protein
MEYHLTFIKGDLVMCNNVDEPGGEHYTELNKPDTEKYGPHMSLICGI